MESNRWNNEIKFAKAIIIFLFFFNLLLCVAFTKPTMTLIFQSDILLIHQMFTVFEKNRFSSFLFAYFLIKVVFLMFKIIKQPTHVPNNFITQIHFLTLTRLWANFYKHSGSNFVKLIINNPQFNTCLFSLGK